MNLVIHIKRRIDTVFNTLLETANKASIKIQLFNLKKKELMSKPQMQNEKEMKFHLHHAICCGEACAAQLCESLQLGLSPSGP